VTPAPTSSAPGARPTVRRCSNSARRSSSTSEDDVLEEVGEVLDDAVAAFNPTKRIKGKTIIRVRP
jgi:hypothetical protein